MEKFALDGFWLIGAFALTYVAGVITSQWVKDKLSGVPAELRAAVKTVESDAKTKLDAAKAAAIADVTNLISPHATAVAAAVVAPAAQAPAPAAQPSPAAQAPAAQPAPAPAPAAPAAPAA